MTERTPERTEQLTGTPPPSRRWRAVQPTAVVWLMLVWVALWGDVSVANLVVGAALGAAICLVFPLPAVSVRMRPRPHLVLWVLLRFVADVFRASAGVIRVVLSPGDLRNSVVAVDLRSGSDLVLTIVAEMTSLVPGSFVVEVRRSSHTLFLHVLDTPGVAAARQAQDRALALEERVVGALGIRLDDREAPPTGGGVL
jgi:multicomponent Na+:H+ antiporter subunit E